MPRNTKALNVAAGALVGLTGVALIAAAVTGMTGSGTSSPPSPAPSVSVSIQASPSTSPASPSTMPTDPSVYDGMARDALTAYLGRVSEAGGVDISMIDVSGDPVAVSFAPNGSYHGSTTDPMGPEWLYADGVLYGRMGEAERTAHQSTFDAVGKPDAQWTDTAVTAAAMRRLFATADIGSAVSDLLPLLGPLSATDAGDLMLTGQIPTDQAAALLPTYAFTPEVAAPVPTPSASAPGQPDGEGTAPSTAATAGEAVQPATVTLLLDKDRALRGYRVAIPGARTVEVTVRQFGKVTVTAPPPEQVITVTDLSLATTLASQNATPAATGSPEPAASPRS